MLRCAPKNQAGRAHLEESTASHTVARQRCLFCSLKSGLLDNPRFASKKKGIEKCGVAPLMGPTQREITQEQEKASR